MQFASHVNLNQLIAHVNDKANSRYTYMIDGRTIHQYLQFIEPLLYEDVNFEKSNTLEHFLQNIPSSIIIHQDIEKYKSFILSIINTNNKPYSIIDIKNENIPPLHLIYKDEAFPLLRNNVINTLVSSLNLLKKIGLIYFIELTIGSIFVFYDSEYNHDNGIYFTEEHNQVFFNIAITKLDDEITIAKRLLKLAAKKYIENVISVENAIHNMYPSRKNNNDICNIITGFSMSVEIEFENRIKIEREEYNPIILEIGSEEIHFHDSKKILKWLSQNIPHLILSKEIFSYWYPFWERRLFIFNSPLDYISTLKSSKSQLLNHETII